MKKWYFVIAFILFYLSCKAQMASDKKNSIDISQDTTDGSELTWAEFEAYVKIVDGFTIITPINGCIGVLRVKGVVYPESSNSILVKFKNGKPF